MALVCVLSVFNGFEMLISTMFSSFDPDLKITLTHGKTFDTNSLELNKLRKMNDMRNLENSQYLEDVKTMYAQPPADAGAGAPMM